MKHGFLITAYHQEEQLAALIRALDSSRSCFFIHVDKTSKFAFDHPAVAPLLSRENVSFLQPQIAVRWAGFSHLRALLLLIEKALADPDTTYFHTLSGQCFPLRPIDDICSFFERHAGSEFIAHRPLPTDSWAGGGINRLEHYYPYDLLNAKKRGRGRLITALVDLQKKLGVRRPIPKYFPKLYGGSTWWSLSRPCVTYIVNFLVANPAFLRRFRHTYCPEEIYFATILANSPFRKNLVNDNYRYIDWQYRNGSRPAVLDASDFPNIRHSNKLFARKLALPQSRELLELIGADNLIN